MYDEKAMEDITLKHFKSLIDAADKPREQIARDVGMDASTITKYYNGDRHLSVSAIRKFANYFNVSSDYLLGLSDAPTNDKDLQAICDYTGLSEEAVLKLREYTIPDLLNINDFTKSEDISLDTKCDIAWTEDAKRSINNFILSTAFDSVVDCSQNVQYINNAFMSCLAIYFGEYEYFYKLHPLEEKTVNVFYYFTREFANSTIHNALKDETDLSIFQMQKSMLDYFDKISNHSEIKDKKTQTAFDWLCLMVFNSAITAYEEKSDIENLRKSINECNSEGYEEELSKLKEIYERLKTTPKI